MFLAQEPPAMAACAGMRLGSIAGTITLTPAAPNSLRPHGRGNLQRSLCMVVGVSSCFPDPDFHVYGFTKHPVKEVWAWALRVGPLVTVLHGDFTLSDIKSLVLTSTL